MPSTASSSSLAEAKRLSLAQDLLYSQRPLRQWVVGDSHVAGAAHSRAIGYDELFFDLVIVATIAVFGDDLRERFTGWSEVHRFLLLYGTVISVWRESTLLYNQIGTRRDLFEKASISSIIVCLAGIGLGASTAFRSSTRAVAGFAFTAHAILAFRLMLSALPGLYDARTANAVAMFLGAVPYLVAVFAPSGATRGLFWAAIGCQLGRSLMYSEFLKFTHVRKAHVRIPAVDVHSLAERYGLITLITFGETFVSTLVEGNRVFQENEARDPVIALSVAAAVLIVYSVHGFYFDIDGRLTREDTHALHRGRFHGVMWTLLHYPLHVGLILAESALGIMVEVVGEVDHNKADDAGEALERVLLSIASRSSEAGEAAERLGYPTRNQVWLLCGSWGLALSSLVLISLMHDKKRRLRAPQLLGIATRCVVAVLMYTAVPLLCVDKLKALPLVFVVCGLLGGAFLLEFTAITFDDHARLKAASSAPRNGEETSNADVRDEEDEPPSATGIDDAAHEAADEAADKVADEANRRRHQHDRHGGPFSTGMHTAMSGLPHRGRRVVHTKSPFRGFSLY